MNQINTIHGRTHAQFPGPIGPPKAQVLRRFSFRNADGSRGWHTRELVAAFGEARAKAITGRPC